MKKESTFSMNRAAPRKRICHNRRGCVWDALDALPNSEKTKWNIYFDYEKLIQKNINQRPKIMRFYSFFVKNLYLQWEAATYFCEEK